MLKAQRRSKPLILARLPLPCSLLAARSWWCVLCGDCDAARGVHAEGNNQRYVGGAEVSPDGGTDDARSLMGKQSVMSPPNDRVLSPSSVVPLEEDVITPM
jgi:hypothetical protein